VLNPAVLARARELGAKFAAASPFRHVVIDDFLDAEVCETLLAQFPGFDRELAMNEDGVVGRKAVHEKVTGLGSAYRRLDALASSEEFRRFLSQVTGIDDLLYDPHYFGGGCHENLSGQGLDPHVDFTHHPLNQWHRRLNLIIYLNHGWNPDWGGSIELHENPRLPPDQDKTVVVPPAFNRAVLFETHNTSWHGFKRVRLPPGEEHRSRKSFALYYYTEDREQKVAPHSTIYVQEHIDPEITAAGHRLSEADAGEIRNHIHSRDIHLARLYKHISGLMGELQEARKYIRHLQQFEKELETIRAQPKPGSGRAAGNVALDETALRAELNQAQERENELRRRLQEMENATFWKITGPLRALIQKLRR